MLTIKAWADDHLFDDSEGLPREIHRHSCGEVLRPVVICECCGKPCSAADVEYEVVLDGDVDDTAEPGSPSGYYYDFNSIAGFSLTHMRGTGGQGNNGEIPFVATTTLANLTPTFSHTNEIAKPGY